MKIILLRHGPPIFKPQWLLPVRGAKNGLERYAASRVNVAPATGLEEIISQVNVCVSSKLNRAIDSANLLGFTDSSALELFNETELPHPKCLFVPLPWSVFLIFYRLLWFAGFSQNCAGKTMDQERAVEASAHLTQLAANNGTVLLVGHGIMNRLISSELQKTGWLMQSKSGTGYWSSITLAQPNHQ